MTALDYFSDAQPRALVPRIVRWALLVHAVFAVAWSVLVIVVHHPAAVQIGGILLAVLPEVAGGALAWYLTRRLVPRWAVLTVLGVEIAFAVSDLGNGYALGFLQLVVPVTLTVLVARDRTPDLWGGTPRIRFRLRPRRAAADAGASILEYAALIVVGALILGGLAAIGIETKLTTKTEAAICRILNGEESDGCAKAEPRRHGELPKGHKGDDAPKDDGDDGGKADDGGHKRDCSGVKWFICANHDISDFFKGIGDGFVDTLKGFGNAIWNMFKGIGNIITNPGDFFKSIGDFFKNPGKSLEHLFFGDALEKFRNGDFNEGLGELIANVGSWFIPGASELGDLGRLGKLGKMFKDKNKDKKDKDKDKKDKDQRKKDKKEEDEHKLSDSIANGAKDAIDAARRGDLKGAQQAAKKAADDLAKLKESLRKDGCAVALGGPIDIPVLPHVGRFGAPMGPTCSKEDRDKLKEAEDNNEATQDAADGLKNWQDVKNLFKEGKLDKADESIDKLNDWAKKVKKQADADPNNKLLKGAADTAKKMADDAKREGNNKKIDQALQDGVPEDKKDKNQELEGIVGKKFSDSLVNFGKEYRDPKNRKFVKGEIDVETDKALIEVTNGKKAKGKVDQLLRNKPGGSRADVTNPDGKETVLYAPNIVKGSVKQIEKKTGCKVFQDMDELKDYVDNLP